MIISQKEYGKGEDYNYKIDSMRISSNFRESVNNSIKIEIIIKYLLKIYERLNDNVITSILNMYDKCFFLFRFISSIIILFTIKKNISFISYNFISNFHQSLTHDSKNFDLKTKISM